MPYVRVGDLVFTAGHEPFDTAGHLQYLGRLGESVREADAYQAARLTVLNYLAQVKARVGSLDRIRRIVHLRGFVFCTLDFPNHLRC